MLSWYGVNTSSSGLPESISNEVSFILFHYGLDIRTGKEKALVLSEDC